MEIEDGESESFKGFGEGQQQERELGFNGQCFFCSKSCQREKLTEEQIVVLQLNDEITTDTGEDDKQRQDPKYLLRKLCGYLKITPNLQDENGFLFCSECEGITNKLTNLFEELDVTQLWIKHFLTQITHKLLEETGQEGTTNNLRKLIQDKCSSKLLRDPQVILENILVKHEAIDFPASTAPPSPPLEPPPPVERSLLAESPSSLEEEDDCIILDDDNEPIENTPKLPSSSSSQNVCRFCSKLYPSISLRRHTTSFHPEQLLLQHKMDHVTLPQFQQICRQLSHQKRAESIIRSSHGCVYCPMEYSRTTFLQCHLFDSHMPMLEAEVIRIQESIYQLQILEDQVEDDQPVISPSSSSSQQEEEETPTPSPSTRPPAPKRKKRLFQPVCCQICRVKLASSSNLTRHMKSVHKIDKFVPSSSSFRTSVPTEVSPSSSPFEINIPSTITIEPCEDDEQAEFFYGDFEEEDHFGWASKLEGQHERGQQQQNQVQVVRGHQCPYCDRILTDVSRLRLHTSNVHTEQLLLHYKEDHVGLEHFKLICNDFLRLNRRDGEVVGEGSRRSRNVACLYCDMIYSNSQYLKFHMIDEHQDVMARELGELQKSI